MSYHNVDIDMILTNNDLIEFAEKYITTQLLLLPELGKAGYINIEEYSMYYIIDSEWNELNHVMQSRCPTSLKYQYQNSYNRYN